MVFRAWHVACFCVLPGCLYIAPVETLPLNRQPVIVAPIDDLNELVLIADIENVRVIARDPDEDALFFDWSGVPSDVEIPPDPPSQQDFEGQTLWLSTYKVPRDPRIDGQLIHVVVSDLQDPVTVEWTVKVEE